MYYTRFNVEKQNAMKINKVRPIPRARKKKLIIKIESSLYSGTLHALSDALSSPTLPAKTSTQRVSLFLISRVVVQRKMGWVGGVQYLVAAPSRESVLGVAWRKNRPNCA